MPAFTYLALTDSGQETQGSIQADTDKHARQILRDMGYSPLEVNQSIAEHKLATSSTKISVQEIALVTRQLASMLQAHLPLSEALQSVADQSKGKTHSILMDVHSQVLEGQTLADALAKYPACFDPLYIASVAAGEKSGLLNEIFNRLADQIESKERFKRSTQMALLYPAILASLAFAVVTGLMAYVVPRITQVFIKADQALPVLTEILIKISSFIQHYGLYGLVAFGVLSGLFFMWLYLGHQHYHWHHFLLKTPILGPWLNMIQSTRFAESMGLLLGSAVPALESMQIATQTASNLYFRTRLESAKKHVQEGLSIHQALAMDNSLPPVMLRLIASGESSGELDKLFHHAARLSREELDRKSQIFLGLLEPLLILTVGLIILFIVLAILLPIFSLNQLVGL